MLNGKRIEANERGFLTPNQKPIVLVEYPRSITKEILRPTEMKARSSRDNFFNFKALIRVIPGMNVRYKNPATSLITRKSAMIETTTRH
jgi:hypothetical protein